VGGSEQAAEVHDDGNGEAREETMKCSNRKQPCETLTTKCNLESVLELTEAALAIAEENLAALRRVYRKLRAVIENEAREE